MSTRAPPPRRHYTFVLRRDLVERLAAYARSERPGARVHLGPHLEEALKLYLEGTEAQRDRGPGREDGR